MNGFSEPNSSFSDIYKRSIVVTDHRGRDVARAWHTYHNPASRVEYAQPPFSFHIYVTYGIQDLENFTRRLRTTLTADSLDDTTPWRLEVLSLPGASTQECKDHYTAERDSRVGGSGVQPPLTTYDNISFPGDSDILFTLDDPEWQTGAGIKVLRFGKSHQYVVEVPLSLEHSGSPDDEMGFKEQIRELWWEDEQKSAIEESFDLEAV